MIWETLTGGMGKTEEWFLLVIGIPASRCLLHGSTTGKEMSTSLSVSSRLILWHWFMSGSQEPDDAWCLEGVQSCWLNEHVWMRKAVLRGKARRFRQDFQTYLLLPFLQDSPSNLFPSWLVQSPFYTTYATKHLDFQKRRVRGQWSLGQKGILSQNKWITKPSRAGCWVSWETTADCNRGIQVPVRLNGFFKGTS